jgi:hypothetical protein
MKQILVYSFFLFSSLLGFSQNNEFKILPFMTATTSIKEGQIEAGPEFKWDKFEKGNAFLIKPTVRIPLTSKTDNITQIDRFSSTWRIILALQYTKDNTKESGKISRHSFSGQLEFGSSKFKYYPTGDKAQGQKTDESSYAFELIYTGFFTQGKSEAKQFSPQLRFRYSYNWNAAEEVGVVKQPNSNGVVTTSNMVIDAPSVVPTFSPAFTLQIYPGKGSFSYSPTVYYDLTGKAGTNNPFTNVNRLRLESWVFFYPTAKDNPNIKIGISPYLSIRTKGTDEFNKVEYGGIITIKFGTTFLQFF